jgi:type II secretory pathway pseudopilin PulG
MSAHVSAQRGFTYIGLLVVVVMMGLVLTAVSRVWRTTEQRERETQLLFAGHAFRMAIASYYASGHRFPNALEELLQDERFPIPKRHLRRLYPDPITGQADWTLVLTPDGNGIMGIASSSTHAPFKRARFDPVDDAFTDADCYCSWQFVYYPSRHNRATGPSGTGTLAPGNTNTLAPRTLGTFTPGSMTTLPPGSGTLTPGGSSLTPGGRVAVPSEPDSAGQN